jgi:hypothetical protein
MAETEYDVFVAYSSTNKDQVRKDLLSALEKAGSIRADWLLGAAYRTNGDLIKAEQNLSQAISMCRQINMFDHEADMLLPSPAPVMIKRNMKKLRTW